MPGPKDSVESKHEKPVELDKPDVITKSEVLLNLIFIFFSGACE